MSKINTTTTRTTTTHRTILFALVVALILTALPVIADDSTPCDHAVDFRPNSALRSSAETAVFRVQVPSTGVLTLELTRPARIEVASCGPGDAAPADVLVAERSEKHAVLAARTAGVLFLRVSLSHRMATPRFKMANDFAAARLVVDELDLGGLPVRRTSWIAEALGTKGDPEDIYPDPDGANSPGRGSRLVSFLTLEASLVHKGDPEDIYPDPDGLVAGASSDD